MEPTRLAQPRFIRHYRIVGVLGRGGFGTTYLAEDTLAFDRRCVVKELKADLTQHPKARELFEREARTLADLRHPGIPHIYAYFAEGDRLYLVEEYIEGETLERLLQRRGRLPEDEVRDIALKVLDILAYLHPRGVVHRDIKPANIVVRQDGSLALIDFGAVKDALAGRTTPVGGRTASVIYTPGYAPPEQVLGQSVDARADIYALGATLIQLLTGLPPSQLYDGDAGGYRWRSHVPALSPTLAAVLDKATNLRATDRYPSAEAMRQALAGPKAAPPQPHEERAIRIPSWVLAMGLIGAIVLLVGIISKLTSWSGRELTPTPVPSEAVAMLTTPTEVSTYATPKPGVLVVPTKTIPLSLSAAPTSTRRPPTPTFTSTPTPTKMLTPTLTPTNTPTQMPAETPMPTSQLPRATPTASPTPLPTRAAYPAPTQGVARVNGERVILEWRWDGQLGPDEHFDVRIWQNGRRLYERGAWAEEPRVELGLSSWPGGTYQWSVAVIRGREGRWEADLSPESELRTFHWGGPSKPSPPTPAPTNPPPTPVPPTATPVPPTRTPEPTPYPPYP